MERWISSAVIYQVNLRSFAAREPRNPVEAAREKPTKESALAYLSRHLPLIKQLGANVVYLMPCYLIGATNRKGIGSPYSIRDFRAVDPEYGTFDELARLVRRAHALGLRIILDITPNHTSRDHEWTRRHREYYVRRNDGELYCDADWTDTAKLDYRQPALRRAMLSTFDFWVGFLGATTRGNRDGVDGFRLDMAHFINDRRFWNEAIPELERRCAERELLFLAECYGIANNLNLFARGVNAAYDDDFYKVCQYCYAVDTSGRTVVAPASEAEARPEFARPAAVFREGGIAKAMEEALTAYERPLPTVGVGGTPQGSGICSRAGGPWLARYIDNHDEGRGLYRFGEGAVRAVMQLVFLAPRTLPLLLAGQEFGALNRPSIHTRIGVCDKGRRIVSGSASHFEPGVEFEGNLFSREPAARREWYEFYHQLIKLRRQTPELTEGGFSLIDIGEQCQGWERSVIAFERASASRSVRCAVNLGPHAKQLRGPTGLKANFCMAASTAAFCRVSPQSCRRGVSVDEHSPPGAGGQARVRAAGEQQQACFAQKLSASIVYVEKTNGNRRVTRMKRTSATHLSALPHSLRRGFTLVELLAVVAIIAFLVSLLLAGIAAVRNAARKNRARTEVSAILHALKAYYNEYTQWPTNNLCGYPNWPANPAQIEDTINGIETLAPVLTMLAGHDPTNNPRRIVFLEAPAGSINTNGAFVDPWGNPYKFMYDLNYDGKVVINFTSFSGSTTLEDTAVAVWSRGPDLSDEEGHRDDDICSWR